MKKNLQMTVEKARFMSYILLLRWRKFLFESDVT